MKKHSKDAQIRTDVSEDFIRSFEEGFQEGKTQALKDELKWLILNRDTRVKLLIETGIKELNGLLYEMNKRIKEIKSQLEGKGKNA